MSLNASFKKAQAEIADAASRNINHARPTAGAQPNRTSTPKPNGKHQTEKRRHGIAFPKENEIPAPDKKPTSGSIAGTELLSHVTAAITYLRAKEDFRPVPFEDIIGYLSLPVDLRHNIPRIKFALKDHGRVDHVPKADSPNGRESFKYRPELPIRNADELRDYLAHLPMASGLNVRDLKDGWPDCVSQFDRIEREGGVLVSRSRDGTAKKIFADNPSYHLIDPATQQPQKADLDFVDFWSKTKLPETVMDLRSELEKAGLTPTSQVKEVRKVEAKKKERKRITRKNGRTTNSHMTGILKDYSGTRR